VRKRTLPWAIAALAAVGAGAVEPPAVHAAFGDKVLRKGSSGRDVRVLQRWLTLVGFETAIDGRFGRRTAVAVRRYERTSELRVDGRVSRTDARVLRRAAYAARGAAGVNGTQASSAAPGPGPATEQATLNADGTATAPASAPEPVKAAVAAANALVTKPYRYGGGHGSFEDSGYDCSGAVSYALHGAGVLDAPLDSSGLMSFGESGAGGWITVYAHGSHAYVMIAGLRFDTSGSGDKGPRWRTQKRSASGYTARHPDGL
jgi:peptidoglycan hydrolase-like protein with peptidoglycan-binding domain